MMPQPWHSQVSGWHWLWQQISVEEGMCNQHLYLRTCDVARVLACIVCFPLLIGTLGGAAKPHTTEIKIGPRSDKLQEVGKLSLH